MDFHLAVTPPSSSTCGSGSQPGEVPGCYQTLKLGRCLQGNQRKGKTLVPTLPLRLPSDLSLWTLSSFPLCCRLSGGAHIVGALATQINSSFLFPVAETATVTTVVQERAHT